MKFKEASMLISILSNGDRIKAMWYHDGSYEVVVSDVIFGEDSMTIEEKHFVMDMDTMFTWHETLVYGKEEFLVGNSSALSKQNLNEIDVDKIYKNVKETLTETFLGSKFARENMLILHKRRNDILEAMKTHIPFEKGYEELCLEEAEEEIGNEYNHCPYTRCLAGSKVFKSSTASANGYWNLIKNNFIDIFF